MGTNSFHGGTAARTDVDYPSPTSTKVKETVDLHLYSPSGPSSSILGPTLPLPFYPPVIILPKPQYTPNATGLNKEPTDLPHGYSTKEQRHNSIKIWDFHNSIVTDSVSWDVMPCHWIRVFWHIKWSLSLHPQGWRGPRRIWFLFGPLDLSHNPGDLNAQDQYYPLTQNLLIMLSVLP